MDIPKNSFRKIILFSFFILFAHVGIELLPIFSDYQLLEEQLYQGIIIKFVSPSFLILILFLLFIAILLSFFLLYFFKPYGRMLYLISTLISYIYLMLGGDWIQYSLTYPLELLGSFLEIFILYLIYLTPLKKEFEPKK